MHKNCPIITATSGFVIVALGAISAWYVFPKVIDNEIHKNIDLIEGTEFYTFWKKQPFPLKFKIYFFNVTNAAEVQNGAAPKLKELGPWVYDEYRERVHIHLDEERDILKYVLKKTYFFNKEDSGCHSEDDIITIINAALVGTALQVEILFPTALPTISQAIPYLYPGAKDVFLTAKVKDILFEGIRLYCQDEEVEFVCGAMKEVLPKTIAVADNGKDFIFSIFGYLNGTDDGPWEMGRGLKNTTKGQVYRYGDEELEMWGDKYCNTINGSDSSVFPTFPGQKREKKIYTFAQDFCRSLYVSYEKESEEFGLAAIRYTSKKESLAVSDENTCFCPIRTDENGDDQIKCPLSGLADVTPCLKAPLLISYPHFYLGDSKLIEYASGLNPKKDLHENYVNIEPLTGTPLSGRKRVQINIQLKPLEGFELLENVSSGIFPILWLEEGVTLPDNVANILISNLSKIGILTSIKWIMILTGVSLMVLGFFLLMKRENMLCFSSNSTIDITVPKTNNVSDINIGFDMNPALYPQLDNRNINNQFTRNRPKPQWNSNAWNEYQ